MIQPDPVPTAADFARAELACGFLAKNLEIKFQIDGEKMTRGQAEQHFNDRTALLRAQTLLLNAAERALKS